MDSVEYGLTDIQVCVEKGQGRREGSVEYGLTDIQVCGGEGAGERGGRKKCGVWTRAAWGVE